LPLLGISRQATQHHADIKEISRDHNSDTRF